MESNTVKEKHISLIKKTKNHAISGGWGVERGLGAANGYVGKEKDNKK